MPEAGDRRSATGEPAAREPAAADEAPDGPRVAYLTTHYPALSHAFIEREVRALRGLGWDVGTYSVHPPGPDDLRTAVAREEGARTTYLLAERRAALRVNAAFVRRHPGVWLTGLRVALGTGAPRPAYRLWQVFYLLEAVVLLDDLQRRGYQHVHVHHANNAADVARLAVTLGRRLGSGPWGWSLSLHGPAEFEDVVGFDLVSKVRSADFTACISEWLRAHLLELAGPDVAPKLPIVRMSVASEAYPAASALRRSRVGPVHVLFVGRLVPEKGPDLLVEAVAALRSAGVAICATVVGSGPLAAHLRELVERRGLGDVVHLAGPIGQEQLPGLYADADVFCLPSYAEGLPVVLMEALSTELPVVTTRITGIPELVVDGENGLLVEPGRVDQLVEALARLAADGELRERLGQAGRQRVRAEFDPRTNAARLADLLGGGRLGGSPRP